MGEGLYCTNEGETVYCDLFDGICDPDDRDLEYQDFTNTILSLLPQTWLHTENEWRTRNESVIARNGHFAIWLSQDSYSRVHVTYGITSYIDPDQEPMARSCMGERAHTFFDTLQLYYDLYVRTSPWTSAKRQARAVSHAPRSPHITPTPQTGATI